MTGIAQPPMNDLWTVPGEEKYLKEWEKEDAEEFKRHDPMDYYMQLQIEDFLRAIGEDRQPAVNGEDGRNVVELFTAIYRSTRDNSPVRFPLKHEPGLDGRQHLIK